MITEVEQPDAELRQIFAKNAEDRAREIEQSTSLWKGRERVKVAEIPLWLLEKWKAEEGLDVLGNPKDPDVQRKLNSYLNSIEYQVLRTAPGRI